MKRASVVFLLFSIRVYRFVADFSAIRSSAQGGDAELVQVGRRAHEFRLDQLVDQLVAEALDVHRAARREMQQRLLALRAADEPAGAARRASSSSRSTCEPQTGHFVGITNSRSLPVRFSAITRTTSGITSPARRTTTVSPIRTSLRRTSSSLCSVALTR
jgi:hypothetical protein